MSRRRAAITQADINRALKAAAKAGAREVSIEGAQIRIIFGGADTDGKPILRNAKKPRSII